MIKIGIVGTGGIAEWHASAFKNNKNSDVIAACDINSERLNDFCNKFDIKERYNNVDELLEKSNIDAVSNTTPDAFHKEISIKAINKNKHIFCEKPLAENFHDAKLMCKALEGKNLINMVNFSYRNSSGYQELCKMVKSGKIGNVFHMDANYYQSWLTSNYWGNWKEEDKWLWRLSKQHGSNGALGDTGVHIFDFAVNAVGDIKQIFTDLKTYYDKGEKIGKYTLDANDGFNSLVRFENGAIGTITNTRYATGHANSIILEVFCSKGALKVELDEARSNWSTLKICRNRNINEMYWETIECPKTLNNYENFIKSIKRDLIIQPDFSQGAKIQKIIDSCIKSNDNSSWIDINN